MYLWLWTDLPSGGRTHSQLESENAERLRAAEEGELDRQVVGKEICQAIRGEGAANAGDRKTTCKVVTQRTGEGSVATTFDGPGSSMVLRSHACR